MLLTRNFFTNWFRQRGRNFPWRHPSVSPFALLVTEMLLRQTRAVEVAKLWPAFLKHYPNAKRLARADRHTLKSQIQILGFGDMRSTALIQAATWLETNTNAEVPSDLDLLLQIPHVGTYSAHAVLCFAFGEKREIVDANVLRFFSRYYGIAVKPDIRRNPLITESARRVLPHKRIQAKEHNYGLLDFAAEICRSGKPRCESCLLADSCAWNSQLIQ